MLTIKSMLETYERSCLWYFRTCFNEGCPKSTLPLIKLDILVRRSQKCCANMKGCCKVIGNVDGRDAGVVGVEINIALSSK